MSSHRDASARGSGCGTPKADSSQPAAPVRVKICGIGTEADLAAALESGASYVGFVFYPPSPRFLAVDKAARLAESAPDGLARVALFVDPEDELLDTVLARVPVDHVQLQGSESPARGAAIRERTGKPVIKAVRLRDRAGLDSIRVAENWADQVLCDAMPHTAGSLPGGTGHSFDWSLLRGRRWARPWLLAGGLTPANLGKAIRLTGARQVDVSSGVESRPGRKDPKRIRAFLQEARSWGRESPRGSMS